MADETKEITAADGINIDIDTTYAPGTGVVSSTAGLAAVTWASGRTSNLTLVVGANPYHIKEIKTTGTDAAIVTAISNDEVQFVYSDVTP